MNRITTCSRNIISRGVSYEKYEQLLLRHTSKIPLVNNEKRAIQNLCRPLSPRLYNSSSVYQLEREHIFGKNWIYAGQLDRLKHEGDYLSINIAGFPVFIYRSPLNNELIAFHNVCAHRAGPIVPIDVDRYGMARYGNQKYLKCQYHSWLYDSRDGALKGTPNFNHSLTVEEKKCLSLKKIHFEVFADQFIFVNLNTNSNIQPINSLLNDLKSDMMAFPLNEYRYLESQNHLIRCNWKVYIDNYQEGYHVHTVHPELSSNVKSKEYTVTNKNNLYSIHHVPARHDQAIQQKFLWLYIYPNLALNLYEDGYSVEHMLPIGSDRTMIAYDFFVRSASDEVEMKKRISEAKESIRRTMMITHEDSVICEQTQINLDAGIYKPGYLSPTMENGVQFFQDRLREDLKSTQLPLD